MVSGAKVNFVKKTTDGRASALRGFPPLWRLAYRWTQIIYLRAFAVLNLQIITFASIASVLKTRINIFHTWDRFL